jgi:hypothetical protein
MPWARASTDGTGKGGQFHFKEGNTGCRGQMKDGAPRGGMDEADEIALLEAMLDRSERGTEGRHRHRFWSKKRGSGFLAAP